MTLEFWTYLLHEDDVIISPMPPAGAEVLCLLSDGSEAAAIFDRDLLEPGDYDFTVGDDSIADRVVAWRARP